MTQAYSYEVIPNPSGVQKSRVVPRPSRPAFIQSISSVNDIATDKELMIARALHNHALVLHQWMHSHKTTETTEWRYLLV